MNSEMNAKLLLKSTESHFSTKVKFLVILAILGCFGGPLMADVVMSKRWACGNGRYHETWYLGSNEEVFHYHKYGGGYVDDGIFVAIPDGGVHGGCSYYEIRLPFMGRIDGGPAHLPEDPGHLPISGYTALSNGQNPNAPKGYFRIGRGGAPELPDGSMIPVGSKFFYWMSRGGSFSLPDTLLEKMVLAEKEQMNNQGVEEVLAVESKVSLDLKEESQKSSLNFNELENQEIEEVLTTEPKTSANYEEGLPEKVVVQDEIEDFLKGMDESGEIDDLLEYEYRYINRV